MTGLSGARMPYDNGEIRPDPATLSIKSLLFPTRIYRRMLIECNKKRSM